MLTKFYYLLIFQIIKKFIIYLDLIELSINLFCVFYLIDYNSRETKILTNLFSN